ncbi:hypothetical protein AB0C52_23530 [Streptomyces sp. NPDC048717]|uniref:hypothetical protein n=1 Tax=Streptomyces sp. NPDC048717 TaxID=3154928 RepID=UPI0034451563
MSVHHLAPLRVIAGQGIARRADGQRISPAGPDAEGLDETAAPWASPFGNFSAQVSRPVR